MGRRIAVVLFNLGGPDGPDAVQTVPCATCLTIRPSSRRRCRSAGRWRGSSRRHGRASARKNLCLDGARRRIAPAAPRPRKQAEALQIQLAASLPGDEVRTFIAMRYWHPFTKDTAKDVEAWGADEVVLLPLYPQFSTTTTGSSLKEWKKHYAGPTRTVCCYPFEESFHRPRMSTRSWQPSTRRAGP